MFKSEGVCVRVNHQSNSFIYWFPSSCFSTMMSAAPPKRMVSSVFITLTSPYRATVTPSSQIHSTKARDSGQPLSPGYSTSTSEPQMAQRRPSAASQEGHSRTQMPPSPSPASAPEPFAANFSPVTSMGKDRGRGESPKEELATAQATSDGNLLPHNTDVIIGYFIASTKRKKHMEPCAVRPN